MAEYVVRHFVWDRQGAAFPPSPLLEDFQTLCPSYELAVVEEAAEDYELPKLPQPSLSFVGVPLNRGCSCMVTEFSKPGSKRRRRQRKVHGPPSRRRVRRWSRRVRTQLEGAASPSDDDKQGRAAHPPRPLPVDYHILCPRFSLPEVEGGAADFEPPEMVQAIFYAMLLSEAVELGVVHDFMAEGLRLALVGLRWSSLEAWMSCVDHELREVYLRQQPIAGEVCGPLDGQEESSGSNDPPPPSSDEE
ncbi:hypothetical protein Cgig2_018533 [Carnegiea gigantea]|uniref:Uncharacterized protein n=1 Tax=Carnegiea gigantea TaxID=171969 RepID=A0A9Q1KN01_9CARY|nr:hypothetical protein Cgig2_018533 [Carnegiea gigantea]